MNIAVIGSKGDSSDCDEKCFSSMIEQVRHIVKNDCKLNPSDVTLVSGGCSFADHVAVYLFLNGEVKGLKLYLPCKFDTNNNKFYENGEWQYLKNPGKRLNQLHNKFNTLSEVKAAIEKGAVVYENDRGFHARNLQIASDCDYMIAFTKSIGDVPENGGTAFTWKACKIKATNKFHRNYRL